MGEPSRDGGGLLVEFEVLDSTNAEVLRRALAGERRALYVRADRQSAGRGRSGRAWQSPPGNLALSRLVVLSCPPHAVPQLSLVAGVALHRAVADLLGVDGSAAARLRLKWPNDLLAGAAKLAGILIEATTAGADRIAVVGIGLNVAARPVIEGRETVALADIGFSPAPAPDGLSSLARGVARHLDRELGRWDDGRGFEAIRAAWLARSLPRGTPLSINAGRGRVNGRFAGLDANGALLLEAGGAIETHTFGDVALIAG